MPIEITDCDGGIGNIIVSAGIVTDQELIDSMKWHLIQGEEKLKNYKYILFDHTALTKMDIKNENVEYISRLWAETSTVNPAPIAAMVIYFSMTASREVINTISIVHELFINKSCWESMVFRTKTEAVRWIKYKVRDKFGIDDLKFA